MNHKVLPVTAESSTYLEGLRRVVSSGNSDRLSPIASQSAGNGGGSSSSSSSGSSSRRQSSNITDVGNLRGLEELNVKDGEFIFGSDNCRDPTADQNRQCPSQGAERQTFMSSRTTITANGGPNFGGDVSLIKAIGRDGGGRSYAHAEMAMNPSREIISPTTRNVAGSLETSSNSLVSPGGVFKGCEGQGVRKFMAGAFRALSPARTPPHPAIKAGTSSTHGACSGDQGALKSTVSEIVFVHAAGAASYVGS